MESKFTQKDLEFFQKINISLQYIESQIQMFEKGTNYSKITDIATISNGGIKLLNDNTLNYYISNYHKYNHNLKITKFVPASGAATRMFKDLYEFIDDNSNKTVSENILNFVNNIEKFAFYEDLSNECQKNNISISNNEKETINQVIELLLKEKGLNYGNLPKALLKFHKYENYSRTPIEEHIVEALNYANSFYGSKLHFTVSVEHLENFKELTKKLINKYENSHKTTIIIDLSIQNPNTNTIAVNADNTPFKDKEGNLIFRPAGHGALIYNLNEIESDIIFIKNIDNVVPDKRKEIDTKYKKALAGILIEYQTKIFEYINSLLHNPPIDTINEAFNFLVNNLNTRLFFDFSVLSRTQKIDFLLKKFDRPIRVCGMVKNTGEPGGGPFFVMNTDQTASLQILEKAQIDLTNSEQRKFFETSTHFNPVDLVISPLKHNGDKFDLTQYVDPNTAFISEKSKEGKVLKALELPGLWNGSMADWNTVFVQVPLETFNPVKTVFDLLREAHQ